jgi:alkanesulfonate monooxygenase SsuD/methylene tetrahydromethanopterin reductase-like flavin-dependent oxidoreductase (luciferase family)
MVMIATVAAATSTIRVGSGGIMLPMHAPLAVAESFRVLEALHPDRIDLPPLWILGSGTTGVRRPR